MLGCLASHKFLSGGGMLLLTCASRHDAVVLGREFYYQEMRYDGRREWNQGHEMGRGRGIGKRITRCVETMTIVMPK